MSLGPDGRPYPEETPATPYPLDLRYDPETPSWWSKGHHDFVAFLAAVAAETSDTKMEQPKHVWWRILPTGDGLVVIDAEPHSRGAFPATVADIGWPNHRRRSPPVPVHRFEKGGGK